MWEKAKNFIAYIIKGVIIPNLFWVVIVGIAASVCEVWKIQDVIKMLAENKSIGASDYIILAVCTVVCFADVLSLLAYFIVGRDMLKKQEEQQKELEKERAELEKEKAAIEEEKRKMEADNVVPPFPPLESRYKISEITFELFFKDREHIVQRQTVCYEVAAPKLDCIHHNMIWTGDGYCGSRLFEDSKRKGYELKEERVSASMIDVVVSFPEEKAKGFSDSYTFETKVTDIQHQMLPFLSRLIKCHTGKLTLKVTAPEGLIEDCKQYVSADLTSDFILSEPQEVKSNMVGDNYCYQHEFGNLELLRHYRLEWAFKEPPGGERPAGEESAV